MTWLRGAAGTALGVVAAACAFEVFLIPLASAHSPPIPNIAADSLDGGAITSRELEEGVATSTFSSGGSRRTGRAPLPGAANVVLLGDSYIVAREVPDASTMGAELERLATAAHRPINVRQYGWRGAVPAQYVFVAPDVIRRWNPERVVVVLSDNDLDLPANTIPPGTAPIEKSWRDRSRLVALARRRNFLLRNKAISAIDRWKRRLALNASPSTETPATSVVQPGAPAAPVADPQSIVGELKREYGARLVIVYVATVGIRGGESRSPLESRLLDACARDQVRCVSTRERMLALRERGVIVRGFPTTTLGEGHLNTAGNALMGQIIWDLIR